MYSKHMAKQHRDFLKDQPAGTQRQPDPNDTLRFASQLPFHVPVLAGDSSLALDFLADLILQIGPLTEHRVDKTVIMRVGEILFDLVILRKYMARPPENDLDIFELVRNNRVTRVWTSHEQALAACYGEPDTSPSAHFVTPPNPARWGLKVVHDAELLLPDDLSFIALQAPIRWTTRPGLYGPGVHKPRRYKPPYLRLANIGVRPKPRPAYKTATGARNNAQKRVTFETDAVEKQPTKRQRSGCSIPEGVADRMGGTQPLTGLRRSARMQKELLTR